MNWKQQLFKPKWRNKDPVIRREAVSTEQDPQLLRELVSILGADEDAGVRMAAARRIMGPLDLLAALPTETDTAVKEVLHERLRQLTGSVAENRPALQDRIEVVSQSSDRTLLEYVAANAPEADLRVAALKKVSRQGFLGDRAIADEDPALRRQAAAAITQESTLKRVIEATRTHDKALHQALSERLHRERLARADQAAVSQEALTICEALEQYLRTGGAPDSTELTQIEKQWLAIEQHAPETLARRYRHDLERLRSPAQPEPQVQSPPAPAAAPASPEVAPTSPNPDAGLQGAQQSIRAVSDGDKPPGDKTLQRLASNLQRAWKDIAQPNELDHELKAEAEQLLSDLKQAAASALDRQEGLLDSARSELQALEQALEDGELHKALEHRVRLAKIGKKFGRDRRWKAVQSEMNANLGRLRELRDWQHWANDKIRKRLIEDMEALPSAGLHPDAVLERIKQLQAEWKALENSEQIPGDKHYASAPWMWRKFNAAGRQAFQITKPFLDKRSEVQSRHLEETRIIAQALAAAAASESPDWKALGDSMGKARKALRSLSSVPARSRQKMAAELKAALEAGNDAMQSHYAEIEKTKLKLIREAALLQHATDRDEAIQQAKSLQSQWTAAGRLWRSRENALWREFRAPIDPLFKALDEQRQSVQQERAEQRAAQVGVCAQLEELLALDDEALADQQGRVRGLEEQWREIGRPERRLQERFEQLIRKFNARERAQQQAAASAVRQRWWVKAELLHQAETAALAGKLTAAKSKALERKWPPSHDADSATDQGLEARFRAALDSATDWQPNEPDQAATIEAARKVCICLEFLAGLPTPEEEKDLRMQYQVERLSASMSGERERLSAVEEARELEQAWLQLAYIPEEHYPAFRLRITKSLDQILEE